MSFTRKHYIECARIIRELRDVPTAVAYHPLYMQGRSDCARKIQAEVSAMFASDNPRFDAERFARACEPEGAGK